MTTYRYKAIIAYDGTDFAGFQVQPKQRTVQGEVEQALYKMAKNQKIKVQGAGRTDAGVHARGQVIHFDLPFHIDPTGIQFGLNTLTQEDITVTHVEQANPDFHSRFQAKGKMYRYRVDNSYFPDPFLRRYTCHHRYPMIEEPVKEAMQLLIGTHDFTSFSSVHSETQSKVRTIYHAGVEQVEGTNEWIFTFVGNGFLYNMVRILMGTLLEVADGRRQPSEIPYIIEAKNREAAGKTLAPEGLTMETVYYDEQDIPGFK
ncbi:tRNA pseudouridine synthase A [Alkalibacterium sp. AK22]|uniref:tRNA pseudouridine(38-40) synthase TruA n=1 Tax=Alkalibacterium sp. AK22 TaxID=1229520 RepID=UPI00045308E2|nr:tRNA pseudouridine(38-40) synthase TruA [Alkalibacterium sp. AK22]EXJ23853.1 tRNA pseudouridine synthase A [Alkalibacterium sp. AK22]